jgi:hypothetical protein
LKKKGFNMTFISIVLAIIVFLGYIYYGSKVFSAGNEALPREACRDSVLAKTNAKLAEDAISFNCHTQFVDIQKNGVIKNGQNIDSPLTDEVVSRSFANELYDCWYEFGAGQLEPFGNTYVGSTMHCMECAEINFDPNIIEAINKGDLVNKGGSKGGFSADTIANLKIAHFNDWLKNNNVGLYGGSATQKQTFYDYITQTSMTGQGIYQTNFIFNANYKVSNANNDDGIYLNKNYAVIYTISSPSAVDTNKISASLIVGGATTIAFGPEVGLPVVVAGSVYALAEGAIRYFWGDKKQIANVVIIDKNQFASLGCSQMF